MTTPETDRHFMGQCFSQRDVDFARKLERERDTLKAEVERFNQMRQEWQEVGHLIAQRDQLKAELDLVATSHRLMMAHRDHLESEVNRMKAECLQNNTAACLFDRDAAIAERDKLRADVERLQKQFGTCSVCGNCAWVTRPDGVTEDCEFCKLRAYRDFWRSVAEAMAKGLSARKDKE